MSAHTPGPWGIDADGVKAGAADGFEPFGSCGCCGSPWMTGDTPEIQQADAYLIAAAPDMLAALRRAVLALAFAAESSPAMGDDYKAVSDAIAKATGANP